MGIALNNKKCQPICGFYQSLPFPHAIPLRQSESFCRSAKLPCNQGTLASMCLCEDLGPQWFHEDSLLHRAHRSAKPRTLDTFLDVAVQIFTYTVVIPPNTPAKIEWILRMSENVKPFGTQELCWVLRKSLQNDQLFVGFALSNCWVFRFDPWTSSSGLVGHAESKLHPFTLLIGMPPGSRSQIRNLELAKLALETYQDHWSLGCLSWNLNPPKLSRMMVYKPMSGNSTKTIRIAPSWDGSSSAKYRGVSDIFP